MIKAWLFKSQSAPWLDGWTYRKSVTLSRASGAVTNYQMRLLVGESSGATGEDVDCAAHCATDFDDLRFTKSDGTTLLDYWIESITGTTPNQLATVWIEFDSIGTGATTFYMYYGKADASSVSNGTNTFDFFDHFLDDPPSDTNWYHWIDNGSETVAGSEFAITGHASYNAWGCKQKFGQNYAYRSKTKVNDEDLGSSVDVYIFGFDDRSANGNHAGVGFDDAVFQLSGASPARQFRSSRDTQEVSSRTDDIESYKVLEIRRNGSTNVKFYMDDVLKATHSTKIPAYDCGILIYSSVATQVITTDWVAVRKYQETEPAWGAWGSETTS